MELNKGGISVKNKTKSTVLTKEEIKCMNSDVRNALLIACASTLQAYCKDAKCHECPLYDKDFQICILRDEVPAYWELPITYTGGVKN